MLGRLAILLLAIVLAACGGGGPTGGPGDPSATPGPSGATSSPAGGHDPGTTPPIDIPEPTLTNPEAIGLAFADPDRAADAVVSLLDVAGIGIYGLDGSLVRAGRVAGPGDPWLFDDEVRGLMAMAVDDARAMADGGIPSTFGDLARPIADLLGEGRTARSVLDAYGEAYALGPDRLMTDVAGGLAFIADEPVSRAVAWFLLVDGFVGLAGSGQASARTAAIAGPELLAAAGSPIFTLPSGIGTLTVADLQQLIPHLPLLAFAIPFEATPGSLSGHEGHGGPGDVLTITARVRHGGVPLASPLTGAPLLVRRNGTLDGLAVDFRPSDLGVLAAHGTATPASGVTTTDALGAATWTYQLRPEPANGSGTEETALAVVSVAVRMADLIGQQFELLPPLASFLGTAERTVQVPVVLGWHEESVTPTFGPGAWSVELAGPAPGAGRYSGVADLVICAAPPTIPHREWTAVLSPTGSQVLHISIGEQADGRVSASVAAGDGELMAWHVDSVRPGAVVDLRFDPALPRAGAPVTFILTATWYTGTDPRTRWSMDLAVTCPEVDGLEQPQPS